MSGLVLEGADAVQESMDFEKGKELHSTWKGIQGDTFLVSTLENDYHLGCFFYHTTTFSSLKCMLRDGFISGLAEEKKAHRATGSMHNGVVCFTTNPLRHLSQLPNLSFPLFTSITHNVYLRFPQDVLARLGIRPVAYKLALEEMRDMPPYQHKDLISEEELARRYGNDSASFIYYEWLIENEWRIKTSRLPLPKETEVFVSSPQQLHALKALTALPVLIDPELNEVRRAVRISSVVLEVRRKMYKLHGAADNTLRAKSHTDALDPRFRAVNEDDTVFCGLIRRAEKIVADRDNKAAVAWLADYAAEEWRTRKWENVPIATRGGMLV